MLSLVSIWLLSESIGQSRSKNSNYDIEKNKECIPGYKRQGYEALTRWQWAYQTRAAHSFEPHPLTSVEGGSRPGQLPIGL